jgi:tetratricopeptide (TPR) repeat protein
MIFRPSFYRSLALGLSLLTCCFVIAIHPVRAKAPVPTTASIQTVTTNPANLLETGRQQYQSGRLSEAVSTWKQAAQQLQQQGDRAQHALSLSYLSLAYQDLSEWAEAQQAIEQSLQILKDHPTQASATLWAQVINTEANLLLHKGQAEAALNRWQQAQKYYEQASDLQGSLGSQINQAQALQQLGFYRQARQKLETINQQLLKSPDSTMKDYGL